MPSKSKTSTKKPQPRFHKIQWGLPVSLDEADEFVSLREYVDKKRKIIDFSRLTDNQRAIVAAKRIELLPRYDLVSFKEGAINQKRAVAEVRAKTTLGMQITRIEMRAIQILFDEVKMKKAGRRSK
jgi:hypothetical protein